MFARRCATLSTIEYWPLEHWCGGPGMESVDYIVVGAGSAGCAVAARLSENAACRVLLLEAGRRDNHLFISMPAGWGKTQDPHSRFNWAFETDPEPGLGGRSVPLPRGRVLGGSSAINGLIHICGQREDYDDWVVAGAPGWGWAEMAPYFRRIERNLGSAASGHGREGPIAVSDIVDPTPLAEAMIRAAEQAGIPRTSDFNGARQEGVGYYQMTADGARRCSAAHGYLRPARGRANLLVRTDAVTTGIVFDAGRATGVRYRHDGREQVTGARAEVILCAGAIGSPQILMLSGIGPAEQLRRHGIPVRVDAPGVGANLQDHVVVPLMWRLRDGQPSLNSRLGSVRIVLEVLNYLLRKRGAMTIPAADVGIFLRTREELTRPNVQFHVMPLSGELDSDARKLHPYPGYTLAPNVCRPTSRGQLSLASADPLAPPRLQMNYLSTQYDIDTTVASIEWARRIAAAPALAAITAAETCPGATAGTRDQLIEYARRAGTTGHHPVGTCRMGADEGSVVDTALAVRGVAGLRVADASVMPRLISGNTNATSIVIGERAADFIRAGRR